MPIYIKKKLQFVFKQLAYQIFFALNGKIKGIIRPSNDSRIQLKKLI